MIHHHNNKFIDSLSIQHFYKVQYNCKYTVILVPKIYNAADVFWPPTSGHKYLNSELGNMFSARLLKNFWKALFHRKFLFTFLLILTQI